MKKIYLLFVAAIMAACSAEQVENETFDSLNASVSGKNTSAASEAENPMGFYAGQSKNSKGTLEISNDCSNFYVQITPTDENPDEVSIWFLNDLAELNGGKNQVQNVADVTESDPQDLLWKFPMADFDLNEDLFVYVKAYGDYAGAVVQEKVSYSDYDFVFENCGCEESFTYKDNEDDTYTFSYIPAEDLTGKELTFTFPQATVASGPDVFLQNGNGNDTTFSAKVDLTACQTYIWTFKLLAYCKGKEQPEANLWTDFSIDEVSKREQFELEKIRKSCS